MREHFEDLVAISGVGISQVGRRLRRDPWALTAEAALAAIADAGLTPDDIGGVSTYPGGAYPNVGLTGAGVWDVRTMLGLNLHWMSGGSEVAGQIGSIINAAVAVGSGVVDHVLCFRTVWESTVQMTAGRAAGGGRCAGRVGERPRVAGGGRPRADAAVRGWASEPRRFDRPALFLRARRYAAAVGADRAQRPPQCSRQSPRRVSRTAEHGAIPRFPHDLGPVVSI